MLKIQNVSKIYRGSQIKALDNVSFTVQNGEFTALLGQNGAGKSSLINILAGNIVKTEGRVSIGGYDLDTQDLKTKNVIGIVPQEISFDHFFTVGEVLESQSGYFGIRNNGETINWLLERLSLSDKKNTNTKALSGGMKRRLLIAKALVHRPKLLILDEPTAGVDIELRHSMYEFLRELNRNGTTIILTTHYLEEAEKLCGRIIILNNGKKVMDAPKDTVMKDMEGRISLEFRLDSKADRNQFYFLRNYSPVLEGERRLKLSASVKDISDILKNMEENKIRYSDIRFENKKLEDLFLNLVKKTGDYDAQENFI